MPDHAGPFAVGASVDKRIDLGVLHGLRRGEQRGLQPGCVTARQVPDPLPTNHDGHREWVKLVTPLGDERRLLEKVDTVRVDVDALE